MKPYKENSPSVTSIAGYLYPSLQIEKLEVGLKVTTDKGDVLETDAVLFATGEILSLLICCSLTHLSA